MDALYQEVTRYAREGLSWTDFYVTYISGTEYEDADTVTTLFQLYTNHIIDYNDI